MYQHPHIDRDKMSAQQALDILIDGNHRFVNNLSTSKDLQALLHLTKDKQHPFVSILSCSDSRVPVELLFDQALGDVFSVRLAGNVATNYAMASLEFGTKYLGSKLIVVLGHSSCGAVGAACDGFQDGHITELLQLIKPAVEQETSTQQARHSQNSTFVANVCALNVRYQLQQVIQSSEIIQKLLYNKSIGIIGGIYELSNGQVEFLEDTARL